MKLNTSEVVIVIGKISFLKTSGNKLEMLSNSLNLDIILQFFRFDAQYSFEINVSNIDLEYLFSSALISTIDQSIKNWKYGFQNNC